MEKVRALYSELKTALIERLASLAQAGLEEANMAIVNQSIAAANNAQSLHSEKQSIIDRFSENLANKFDELLGDTQSKVNVLDYASLSLVDENDLEAIIAMEGMISHSRNCDIQQYLSFTTRLDALFYGVSVDESNNPMDPEQIGDSFKDAMRPVGLNAAELLIAYRSFNQHVFHALEQVLTQANEILIGHGVIPDLEIAARDSQQLRNKRRKARPKSDPVERAFSKADAEDTPAGSAEVLSFIQKLMHSAASESSAPAVGDLQTGMMVAGQRVELVANDQLINYLAQLQASPSNNAKSAVGEERDDDAQGENLNSAVSQYLQQSSTGQTLKAIDSHSSDIINLVTLLYDAIWQDETVPIPVKELIGRTQITVLKIALEESAFFDSDTHPVRLLINELATAGISWTDFDKLEKDPMYKRMQSLVSEFVGGYDEDSNIVEVLLDSFRNYKESQLAASDLEAEAFSDSEARNVRMDEINDYALAKIQERVLGEIDASVRDFLETQFRQFVVQVVLREGPGGVSWKPVMNTIDVLLWTVQSERTPEDLKKFVKVSPRLLANLRKALDVAKIDEAEAEAALSGLKHAQEAAFKPIEKPRPDLEAGSFVEAGTDSAIVSEDEQPELESLPQDDDHLREVSSYPIGIWLEFRVGHEQSIRCTLAAKIDTIEKYVFVNSQGVKVIEKSRMGLARELKAGTVKVISEAPLIDRAMESVIAKLREENSPGA